jgi:hypothetical protein
MTAKALIRLECNACKKRVTFETHRAWKARAAAKGKGWTSRPRIGPRGGQGYTDFCADCSALMAVDQGLQAMGL